VSGKNKKSILVKIYLMLLFICGMVVWFTIRPASKQKISTNIILEKNLVNILASNNIKLKNILKQSIRGRNFNSIKWNEFYKITELNKSVKN
jgi:hypothetical protein